MTVFDLDRLRAGRLIASKAAVPSTNEKVGNLALTGLTTDSSNCILSILEKFILNKLLEGEVVPASRVGATGTGSAVVGSGLAAPAAAKHNLTWTTKVDIPNLNTITATVQINPPVQELGKAVPAEAAKTYEAKATYAAPKSAQENTKPSVSNNNPLLFTLEIDGVPFPPFLINETNDSTLENAVWKLTEEGVIDIFKPQVDYKTLVKPEIIEFLGEQIEVFSEFQTKIENPTQQISAPIISIMIALLGIAQGLEIGNEDTVKTGILMIVTNLLLMNE